MLFHPRLCAQRPGHIVQIQNLVSLVCCERNGLNRSVAAFILLPIRLGDKSSALFEILSETKKGAANIFAVSG